MENFIFCTVQNTPILDISRNEYIIYYHVDSDIYNIKAPFTLWI